MHSRRLAFRQDPTGPLLLGTSAARVITYVFAVASAVVRFNQYERPWLAGTVLVLMAVWTPVTVAYCLRPAWRRSWFVILDIVVTCALMVTSRWISGPEGVVDAPLITSIWAGIVAVAAGTIGGWRLGVGAGLVLTLCTGLTHWTVDHHLATNGTLMVLAGLVVGLAATTARQSAAALARALRTEAATAERERLASSIHDSVLQVLARVRRRGAELGGEAAELAMLAGEQEIALRSLVASGPVEQTEDGEVDLRALLTPMATSRVEVATPGTPTLLPSAAADDLAAAVSEALTNVSRHAGTAARAWVLVEDLGDEVIVSVRDDGAGIPAGRLADALAEGRLGVANSIMSKLRHLGGTATVDSATDQGTEWEMRVPRATTATGRNRP